MASECVACLEPARTTFRKLPVCVNCWIPPRASAAEKRSHLEWLLKQQELKKELSPLARLKVWPEPGCPIPGGYAYALLGPPRRVTNMREDWDEEVARQHRLVKAGLLRRGFYREGDGRFRLTTLGWQQYSNGRFAWSGYDNFGIPMYSGHPTGQVGGSWPSPDDYLQAWDTGQDLTLGIGPLEPLF